MLYGCFNGVSHGYFVLLWEQYLQLKAASLGNLPLPNILYIVVTAVKRITILINSIYLARDILKDRFFLTHRKLISSNNALIPIIYWLWRNNKKALGSENNCVAYSDISQMRTWFIKALLSGVFGGQSDTVLHKCKIAIDECQHQHFPAKEIEDKIKKETKKIMDITKEDIEKISYNSPNSHLVLSIIYKSAINFQPVLQANIPEQDHIFSQDELNNKYAEKEINTIYNIRYVGKAPNQAKSNKPFKEWIRTQGDGDREMNLIPDGNWDIATYPQFIERRKKLILDAFEYQVDLTVQNDGQTMSSA